MKKIVAVACLSMVASVAHAASVPPRDAGITLTSSTPMVELQACVMRKLVKQGEPLIVPAENGVDIDVNQRGVFFTTDPRMSVHLRDTDGVRAITFYYRHPLNTTVMQNVARGLTKACLTPA